MFKKQILLIMCFYTLLYALPPDSVIVPAVIGESTTGDFDGDAWFSFTLNDSSFLRLQAEGHIANDVFFYRDTVQIGIGNSRDSKVPIYIHDCGPGNYFIHIDRWTTGGLKATVTIDTFSLDYRPQLEINQLFHSMNNTAPQHFYCF